MEEAKEDMRALIVEAGFSDRAWPEVAIGLATPDSSPPRHTVQRLVTGHRRVDEILCATLRIEDERRIVMIQAVCVAGPTS